MERNTGELKGKYLENSIKIDDNTKKTSESLEGNNQYKDNQSFTKNKDSNEEFLKMTKKVRLSAENILSELIANITEKEYKLGDNIIDKTECKAPLTDVLENDSTIIVRVDLPGVEKEDISVHLIEKAIEIMAVFPGKGDPGHYIQRERNYGKTIKRVTLPKKINEKTVKSTFKDSILTIELPKLVKDRYKVDIN
jgi:HSP20 family molecular chaperone IbpA